MAFVRLKLTLCTMAVLQLVPSIADAGLCKAGDTRTRNWYQKLVTETVKAYQKLARKI